MQGVYGGGSKGGMVAKRGFRGRGGETGVEAGVRGQVVNYPDRHHQLLRPRVPVRTCGLALRSLTLQIVLFFASVQDFNLALPSSHSLTSFLFWSKAHLKFFLPKVYQVSWTVWGG